eukprot:TRINITY_DN8240_c0_g1_i1.p1 TRINITY_DN8240_c0_g1~~TRINITY_DN8240_c0_g1_i1.p1  ORF type:complete len:146 (+),score=12.63 TRINITY_DN8240_c0_g1_i1:203-640(+)
MRPLPLSLSLRWRLTVRTPFDDANDIMQQPPGLDRCAAQRQRRRGNTKARRTGSALVSFHVRLWNGACRRPVCAMTPIIAAALPSGSLPQRGAADTPATIWSAVRLIARCGGSAAAAHLWRHCGYVGRSSRRCGDGARRRQECVA